MTWNWFTVLAAAGFIATSVALLVTLNTLSQWYSRLSDPEEPSPGRRARRLLFRRVGVVVGSWQVATGLLIAGLGQWVTAIPLIGMGGMFLFGAYLARRFGVSPWWAPEMHRD